MTALPDGVHDVIVVDAEKLDDTDVRVEVTATPART